MIQDQTGARLGQRRSGGGPFVGRVLEASAARFLCACFELEGAPPLGALVSVDSSPPLVGVVSDIRTEGRDPGRRPAPHGSPSDDRARVLQQNPQIPALLQTSFEALVVGYGSGASIHQGLPAFPAPIYDRVQTCSATEVLSFTERLDFLRLMLVSGSLADEVTIACLRGAAATHADPRTFLVRAGKALATELAAEPDRLAALLRRLRP